MVKNTNLFLKYKEYEFPCPDTPSSCHSIPVTLPPASYYIELWGASSANSSTEAQPAYAGKGGYTKGKIVIKEETTLYLYIGGISSNQTGQGGWNGGGTATPSTSATVLSGGGGATDIRSIDGEFNNSDSLDSRILVAGGGGGSYRGSNCYASGGNGGGINGEPSPGIGGCNQDNQHESCYGGQESCEGGNENAEGSTKGTKGKGADATDRYRPGGGGGYYGGGSSLKGSGGGSGYINGTQYFPVTNGYTKTGVHYGSGKAIIMQVTNYFCKTSNFLFPYHLLILLIPISIMK